MDSLDRILKRAAAAGPGNQAMAAAAQSAGSIPGAVRAPAMPAPEEPPVDPAAISKLQNEVGKRDKEIADLRAKVQDAKNQAALVQMKQQMSEDREKMRDELRKEYTQMQDKIRSQQKELDNRQALFKQEEANHKAQMLAAQAQHKSKLAEIASNHQTTLQNQVADQKITLAQNEAKSLKQIADMESQSRMQQADEYIAMTDKVRKESDRIQQEKERAFAAKHPAVSPLLQDRINNATSAVARLAKNNPSLEMSSMKVANVVDRLNNNYSNPYRSSRMPVGDNSRLQSRMAALNAQFGGDHGSAAHASMAVARAQNALARARHEGNKSEVEDLQHYIVQQNDLYNRIRKQQEALAEKGDVYAKRDIALDNAQHTTGWFGGSELDKVRNQWQTQQDDENRRWYGYVGNFLRDFTYGGIVDSLDDISRSYRVRDHFGAKANWWDGATTEDPNMQATHDAFMAGASLPQSIGANAFSITVPVADAAFTAATLGAGTGVKLVGKGLMKGVSMATARNAGAAVANKGAQLAAHAGASAINKGTQAAAHAGASAINKGTQAAAQAGAAAVNKGLVNRGWSAAKSYTGKAWDNAIHGGGDYWRPKAWKAGKTLGYITGRVGMNMVLPPQLTGINYGQVAEGLGTTHANGGYSSRSGLIQHNGEIYEDSNTREFSKNLY